MNQRNSWDFMYNNLDHAGEAWKDYGDLFVLDHFIPDLKADTRVIEVGCGDGRNMIHLLRLGFTVTGIDISQAALSRAEELAKKYGFAQRLTLIQGDAQQCGLPTDMFDIAYSTQVLDHVENPVKVIQETHRILRPGGRFFAQLSATSDTALSLGEHIGPKERKFHGLLFRFFDRSDIDSLFAAWLIEDIFRVVIQDPPHPGWRDEKHEHDYWVVTAAKTKN